MYMYVIQLKCMMLRDYRITVVISCQAISFYFFSVETLSWSMTAKVISHDIVSHFCCMLL